MRMPKRLRKKVQSQKQHKNFFAMAKPLRWSFFLFLVIFVDLLK